MRDALKQYNGEQGIFTGIMSRYGTAYDSDKLTILLKNIKDGKGNFITDHVWMEATKQLKAAHLMFGDEIQFSCVVRPYDTKHGCDFGFVCVSNIKKIGRVQRIPSIA